MKIRFLILAISLAFTSSQAISKDKILSANPGIDELIKIDTGTSKDDREKLSKFDFEKLFESAEGYFKKAKTWKKIKCEPINGFLCTKHYCNPRNIKSSIVLDKENKKITRCEGDVCETNDAEFEQTGVFFNVQTKGPIGSLIRVLGDSRYKEITTVGLDAYIANGNCEIYSEEK